MLNVSQEKRYNLLLEFGHIHLAQAVCILFRIKCRIVKMEIIVLSIFFPLLVEWPSGAKKTEHALFDSPFPQLEGFSGRSSECLFETEIALIIGHEEEKRANEESRKKTEQGTQKKEKGTGTSVITSFLAPDRKQKTGSTFRPFAIFDSQSRISLLPILHCFTSLASIYKSM